MNSFQTYQVFILIETSKQNRGEKLKVTMSLGSQNVAFPRKLYDLIESEPDELIEWSDNGDCFFIRDQDEFCAQVLSKYFRHTKLTSFQRQLNLYGFRRITKGVDTGAYAHPLFSRDDPSHVDTIKRVVRKGANGGGHGGRPKWNPNNRARQTGASPNSSHSFPDVSDNVPAAFKNTSRQVSSSWPYPSSSNGDDSEEEESSDDDYKVSNNGNTYSKPYYNSSSRRNRGENELTVGVEVPNNSRRNHRYGTRGAAYDDQGDEMDDSGWDGYPHSAPSPSGFGGGDNSMNMDSRSMPMPVPMSTSHQFGYSDKSMNRNQGGAPLSPHSHPPHSHNQFNLLRPTTSSDCMLDGGGLDPLGMPKMARSASALSAELNNSLAGSETWNFDGNASGSNLDLKDLDDLDQFNFDASFGDESESSAFAPMDM